MKTLLGLVLASSVSLTAMANQDIEALTDALMSQQLAKASAQIKVEINHSVEQSAKHFDASIAADQQVLVSVEPEQQPVVAKTDIDNNTGE